MRRGTALRAYVTVEVFHPDGKRQVRRRFASRSFVEAFLSILLAQADPFTAVAGVTDTGGTNRDLIEHADSFRLVAGLANDDEGILVGTGSTAVAVTDYALATQIVDGSSSGQLLYQLQAESAMTVSDPNASFTIQRDFLNSSGASITVTEVGLVGRGRDATQDRYFLLIRDLIPGGQAVADGMNLRITYTIVSST